MTVMQAVLICGGTKRERQENAQKRVKDVSWEDLTILDGEDSLGIEEIRQLEHRLNLKPLRSAYKACIIEGAQRLTLPSQNAILKTLEEPPKNTLIILTVSNRQILLPTIVSRCLAVELAPKTDTEISDEEFKDQLLTTSRLLSSEVGERLAAASCAAKNRREAIDFCDKQTVFWHKVLHSKLKTSSPTKQSNILTADLASKLEGEVGLTTKQLADILRGIGKTKQIIESNVNLKLALEIFFLDLPRTIFAPKNGAGFTA